MNDAAYPAAITTPENWPLEWSMTSCERLAMIRLLGALRPAVSLEIGTYRGGSLQALSEFSQHVISVDIDPTVPARLQRFFPNVTFRTGDSLQLLPQVVAELNASPDAVGFVLIDGDHSSDGVRRDIDMVLKLVPKTRIVVILHDSFNPDCRAGMRRAAWAECAYCHWVELDFVPGVFQYEPKGSALARSMWAGFGCAVLEPHPRSGPLVIEESQRELFETVRLQSCHHRRPVDVAYALFRKIAGRAKRFVMGLLRT